MNRPRVGIIGGGLAGMAAAVVLREAQCDVTLWEARSRLGGRASSFADPTTGELIDFCQHVSMGCCTNLADFCRRVDIAPYFSRNRSLRFVSPEGRHSTLKATRWLPAPLHLAPALLRLNFLSLRDRVRLARALVRLARSSPDTLATQTIAQWLRQQHQSSQAIERFWNVVLVSALAETLDRISAAAARKVFVDGFLRNRHGYEVLVPDLPLGTLYGDRLAETLSAQGVDVRLSMPAQVVASNPPIVRHCNCEETYDAVVVATPWRTLEASIAPSVRQALPELDNVVDFPAAPITGVHLWFDRPIADIPHAVLVGRLSQWMFARPARAKDPAGRGHYYQVVISASHELPGQNHDAIAEQVVADLQAVFPAARAAQLLNSRVVTERAAVFSPTPAVESQRPGQHTAIPTVVLAGDWTSTGWPATMEGAVRSGYLAAETVLQSAGHPSRFVVPDLKTGWLARWLLKPVRAPSTVSTPLEPPTA